MQKCEAFKDLIQKAKDKQKSMKQALQDVLNRMNNIKRGEKLISLRSFSTINIIMVFSDEHLGGSIF